MKQELEERKVVRVAIYCRISNEEKARSESNSLASQKEICDHYIQVQREKGWRQTAHYEDPGYSGGNLLRPGLQKLLSDIRAGKLDAVVVYKLDRLSRSLKDFYQLWEQLESLGVAFASATQSFDTSTSTGKLMLNMLLSFAQFEREQTMERTAARMASRAEKGQWNGGWHPMGYDYDKEKKLLTINHEEAQAIRKIFQLVSEGCRPAEVKNTLNSLGHRTKERSVVRRDGKARLVGKQRLDEDHVINIVRNPAYKGFVKHKDNLFPGLHKPIIDPKLWAKANEELKSRSPRIVVQKDDHIHLLKGLVKCGECGLAMTPFPAGKKDKNGEPYLYYSCISNHPDGRESACRVRSIPARPFEASLRNVLRELGRNEKILGLVLEEANREANHGAAPLLSRKEILQQELVRLSQQIRRLVDIFKQKDLVSQEVRDEYKTLLAAPEGVQVSLEKLEIDLSRVQQHVVDAQRIKEALAHFDNVIGALSLDDQKELMQLLIKGVVVRTYDPVKEKAPLERGWFSTRIRTKWYRVSLELYDVPIEELDLSGLSSENRGIGCPDLTPQERFPSSTDSLWAWSRTTGAASTLLPHSCARDYHADPGHPCPLPPLGHLERP